MVILSCLGLWVGVGDLGELPPHAGKSWNSSPWVEFPIPKDKRPHGLTWEPWWAWVDQICSERLEMWISVPKTLCRTFPLMNK